MTRADSERLIDIRDAIARCRRYEEYLRGFDPVLSAMAAFAIERNLEIIGEAAIHLSTSVTDALSKVDWRGVRGLRNHLAHEYFRVDAAVIDAVMEVHLDVVENAIDGYLGADREGDHYGADK